MTNRNSTEDKNPLDELFKQIKEKGRNSFTPIEVTIRDSKDNSFSTRKLKNIVLAGVNDDDTSVVCGMQGAFSIADKMILAEALKQQAAELTPSDDPMLSFLLSMMGGE